LNSGNPWPQERVREFLDRQMRQFAKLGFCYWKLVLKQTNSFAGFCGMQPLAETGEPEIGWTLTPSCWGQGLATEAASETVRDAFERVGMDHVVALAHPENRATIRVMEKLGMSYEKEMLHRGQIHVFYAMRKEGWLSKGTH
jgi:ribosomal-protein-alanine N-acetyltransferase